MAIPGMTETQDKDMLDRAEASAESLLADLKEKVQTQIKDIGTLRKELQITVPAQVITDRLDKDYNELRGDAVLPGFRKGKAPMTLLRKKFSSEVLGTLKTSVVGQSYFAAVEKEKLSVLGDPLFRVESGGGVKLAEFNEALPLIKFEGGHDFSYTCEIEIKPTFELPEIKGIAVKRPQIELGDKDVNEYIDRQQKIRGHYDVVNDRGADGDDMIIADVKLMHDGKLVKEEANVQLGVRATRLDGIPLLNLGAALKGAKSGDSKSETCTIPDDYERADLRGKQGTFEFKIHEVKELHAVELKSLIEQFGCSTEEEFRGVVREELETERDRLVAQAQREQIYDYLLNNTSFDLPENLSARQTDRAVARRVIELQQSGVPLSDVETRIDELRTSAHSDVVRGLKLEFILEKIAEKLEVRVTEEEMNTEIARIARLYRQRFDRIRDDLHSRGLLGHLAEQIRQDKCVASLLREANIEDVNATK